MLEIIGIVGSLFVLVSFLINGEKNIRLVNIAGAIISTVYGILIGAFSVWALNGTLTLIHIYKLVKMSRK